MATTANDDIAQVEEEESWEKYQKEQSKSVHKQAITDAINGRNRELLDLVLKDINADESGEVSVKPENYTLEKAKRMQRMLQIQDDMRSSLIACKKLNDYTQFKDEKKTKEERAKRKQEEKAAEEELASHIGSCEEFIAEMKKLHGAAQAAKDGIRKEQETPLQQQRSITKEIQKQHSQVLKEMQKRPVQIVDGHRVWTQAYTKGGYVKRQDPWTDRERGFGEVDEELKEQLKTQVQENPRLDTTVLKLLIKETYDIITEMYYELAEATREQSKMRRLFVPKYRAPLQLDKKTLTEIRRYQKPPAVLHRIVQAMLLLLDFDEYTTFEWEKCKSLLNPNSSKTDKGFNTRIEQFNVERFREDPLCQIAARAKEIMEEMDFDKEVRKTSPAAVTLYIWVMGTLRQLEDGGGSQAEPADVKRQIEILRPKDSFKKSYKQHALSPRPY